MAKLKIYTFPDRVLATQAQPIARVEKSLWKLADDMLETMYDAPGIGLAANQVGVLDRIIVIDTEYDLEELDAQGQAPEGFEVIGGMGVRRKDPKVIINPKIVTREGTFLFEEGCLSVPEYVAEVQRSEKVTLEYQDLDGVQKRLLAEGLLAVAIQHEIDHLDGRLFIDRLSSLKKDFAKKKLLRERKERETEVPLPRAARNASTASSKKKGF